LMPVVEGVVEEEVELLPVQSLTLAPLEQMTLFPPPDSWK
jgi:hypothetical protein